MFAKEKGWRCGKSFISWRSRCYINSKTGRKLGYKYQINPKTGRRRKVRVGLTYKEYQKARTKAVKKQGQGKKLTSLEKKYIADTERLATSTRKKKQRAVEAKNKRKTKIAKKSANIPFKDFKKPLKVKTINDNLSGYAFLTEDKLDKISDQDLIKEWRYSSMANAYARYPNKFEGYKTKIYHQKVKQLGGEDYRKLLSKELDRRNILEVADNSFNLSFVSQPSRKNKKTDHVARRRALKEETNTKAIDILANNITEWQLNSELRTSVAELIDESKKKVIKEDIGTRVTNTLKKAGIDPIETTKQGKRRANQEFLKTTDAIADEVMKNQKNLKNSTSKKKVVSEKLKEEADKTYWDFSRRSNVNPSRMVEAKKKLQLAEEAEGRARMWNRPYSKKSEGAFGYKNQTIHKRQVKRAIEAGKKVPDNVLEQYPDLKLIYKDKTPLHTLSRQEYINEFPGTKKKLQETYGDLDIDKLGNDYLISYSDRSKNKTNGSNKGQGKTLKEAAYSFAVRNKLSPDHFYEVRNAVEEGKEVRAKVLRDYGNAFALKLDEIEEKRNKPTTYSHFLTSIQFSVLYPNLFRFA